MWIIKDIRVFNIGAGADTYSIRIVPTAGPNGTIAWNTAIGGNATQGLTMWTVIAAGSVVQVYTAAAASAFYFSGAKLRIT